jgi:hypothetical protein
MKCNPLLIICCVATTIFSYSCNKAAPIDAQPQPEPGGRKQISLVLGGDISTNESPLPGGRKPHDYVLARTLRDSTIYAVEVRYANSRQYALGLFNNPEDMVLELPENTNFTITAAAFRKGTAYGLWYTWHPVSGQFFDRPFSMYLKNKMETVDVDTPFLGYLGALRVFAEDTTQPMDPSIFPEVETFIGSVNVYIDSSGYQQVVLPVRRAVFGIRFNAQNFTDGKLIVEHQSSMRSLTFTPENIANSLRIYTCDDYRYSDIPVGSEQIYFVLKWERADGTVINLGSKMFPPPARNHMITVDVTLPTPSTVKNGLNITLTDTGWSSSETIDL